MIYLLNSFSANMLADLPAFVEFTETTADVVAECLTDAMGPNGEGWTSAVGHADTAAVFSGLLKMEIPTNRVNVTLTLKDLAFIGQLSGPRLPEGATTLPDGATIRWIMVNILE